MKYWALAIPVCLALSVSILLIVLTPGPVYAADWNNDTISVTQIALRLGQALGFVSEAALIGGIILGLIFILLAMLPAVFIARKANTALMYILIVGISVTAANIAMTIWPWWILLLMSMFIALLFSGSVREWITGESGG